MYFRIFEWYVPVVAGKTPSNRKKGMMAAGNSRHRWKCDRAQAFRLLRANHSEHNSKMTVVYVYVSNTVHVETFPNASNLMPAGQYVVSSVEKDS
jgi:hypothetical protein